MRIQKKHKVYAGIVGAALAAWAVDSLFFESAPPASSDNASAASVSVSDALSPGPQPVSQDNSSGPNWLARQLRNWSQKNPVDPESSRDVFSIPPSWASSRPKSVATTEPVAAMSSREFQHEHHLTMVIVGPRGGSALIDGNLLRVGQTVGGCRLTAVSTGRADFIGPDGSHFHLLIGPAEQKEIK